MRAALLLLFAAAAQAQPYVSGEVIWRSTSSAQTFNPAPQAARLAADGDGYVAAWSEVEGGVSRACVGRLTASGGLATAATCTERAADAPSIMPFGDRYIAAWLEPGTNGATLVSAAFDRAFKLLSARPVGTTTGLPSVQATATRAFVASGKSLYEVDREGAPLLVQTTALPIDDISAAGEEIGFASHESKTTRMCGFASCYEIHSYLVAFTRPPAASASKSFQFDSNARVGVASNGGRFLVAWFQKMFGNNVQGVFFDSEFGTPFSISSLATIRLDALVQPQIASDGTRWVVVWDNGNGIEGAAVRPGWIVVPLTISPEGHAPGDRGRGPGSFSRHLRDLRVGASPRLAPDRLRPPTRPTRARRALTGRLDAAVPDVFRVRVVSESVRVLPVLVLLLATSTTQAQPTVGDEVVWRTTPMSPPNRLAPQAARVAADRDGYVVAWSEFRDGASHACAGRLTAAGRLPLIGVCTAGAGDAPAIAPFGDRYIAAWLEPGASDGRAMLVTAALDRKFGLLTPHPVGFTIGAPIVRTAGSRAYVASGNLLHEVNGDGAPVNVFDFPQSIDDLAIAGDQVGSVIHAHTVSASIVCPSHNCFPLPPPPPPPSVPVDKYVLTFTWLYRLTSQTTLPFKSDAPASVSAGAGGFLVLWSEYAPKAVIKASIFGSSFEPFVVSERGTFWFDALTQPQVAWDGVRWVAVWARGDSIEGAVIESDRKVTPLTVSARGGRPAIVASRKGRFLVTYEVVDFDQRRLASRLIDFGPPGRERAVR